MNDTNPDPALPPVVESTHGRPRRIPWFLFFAGLLGPPLLTFLVVMLVDRKGDIAPVISVVFGGAGGTLCGALLGLRFGSNTYVKVALGIVFALVMGVVVITMSCVGCLAGGFKLNFH